MDRESESLKPQVEIRICRKDLASNESPSESVYRLDYYEGMTLHRALEEIYRKLDPTLAFRPYRCNKGICMSCLVSVDKKRRQSCTTFLRPGDRILVESEKGHPPIRDLVTAFE
jgi:succinate dehydrogenase/fumarate reductase-like Fe-S protein